MTSHKRTNSEYIDYVGLAAPQLSQKGTTSESLTGGGAPLPGGRESAGDYAAEFEKIQKNYRESLDRMLEHVTELGRLLGNLLPSSNHE